MGDVIVMAADDQDASAISQHSTAQRDSFASARDLNIIIGPASEKPASSADRGLLWPPVGRLPACVRGRDWLLERLTGLLTAPDGRAHVLTGLGGIGKSTVALRVAEVADEIRLPVWWVPAGDAAAVTASLLGLAQSLGASAALLDAAQSGRMDACDVLWSELEKRRGWLLVIDNADDVRVLTVGGRSVRDGNGWVRGSRRGLVLVTSRHSDAGEWGQRTVLHPVGWLTAADGGQVLLDLAPHAGSRRDAEALSVRLGGLALALHHAGSQLASPFSRIRTFAGYRQALDRGLPARSEVDDREVLSRTWGLSLRQLAEGGVPQARPLLGVLSWFAGGVPIPTDGLDHALLGQVCDDPGARGVHAGLAALLSAGLVEARLRTDGEQATEAADSSGVMLHPLVVETTRYRLSTPDAARTAAFVAVELLAAATARLSEDDPADWPTWHAWLPHLDELNTAAASLLDDRTMAKLARISGKAARMLIWAGAYTTTLKVTEIAIRGARRHFDPTDIVVSDLLFGQAIAHQFLGGYAEAERLYREVLAVRERVLGPDHQSTLATRHEIAWAVAEQGDLAAAERLYREVLRTQERVLGGEHPSTLDTRLELARVVREQGDLGTAERMFRDVLQAYERVLGNDHPSTLSTRHEIARLAGRQGAPAAAERLLRQLLATAERVLGKDHPLTLSTRHEIARLVGEQGDPVTAERLFRDVLEARERILGSAHPATRATATALAELTRSMEGD